MFPVFVPPGIIVHALMIGFLIPQFINTFAVWLMQTGIRLSSTRKAVRLIKMADYLHRLMIGFQIQISGLIEYPKLGLPSLALL